MLNNINTINTITGTPYKVFTPYYNTAKLIDIKNQQNINIKIYEKYI